MTDARTRPVWISAHLFHRGNLDDLITGTVAPLAEELADVLGGLFFLRYWEGGPHLRLRLLPASPGHAGQIRSTLLARGTRYLSEHPSPPAPAGHTAAAYRTMAQRLATAERLTDHDTVLHPDDTVEFIAYQPEHAAFGPPPTLTAVETHFTESSTITLRLLTAGTSPAQRAGAALAMLMLTLAVCEPDLGLAAHRLSSTPPGRIPGRPEGDQHTRDALREQAHDLWARAHHPGPAALGGELAAWLHSIRTLHTQLRTAHAQGRFAPTDCLSPLAPLAHAADPRTPAIPQALLRCTHLLCNRLGITTAETHITTLMTRTLTDLDHDS